MSLGVGARANILAENDREVVYEYGGYNLNVPQFRNKDHLYDGRIVIQKECFVKPEVHEKYKKTPSGRRKRISKRIPVYVDYPALLKNGMIVTQNCSNCWRVTDDSRHIDVMIFHLLFRIFQQYQHKGMVPERVSYNI